MRGDKRTTREEGLENKIRSVRVMLKTVRLWDNPEGGSNLITKTVIPR